MVRKWSSKWKSSKQPRKQRKYRYNAPLHVKSKFLHVHLSKDLRKKYGIRALRARKGDTVKVLRGKFKKHVGKITRVDVKNTKIYIEGVEQTRRDGTKSLYPLEPSNLMLVELNLDDKVRRQKLEKNASLKVSST